MAVLSYNGATHQKSVFGHLYHDGETHAAQNAHGCVTIHDTSVWIFCKFSKPNWEIWARKCKKVPNYPMLRNLVKNSCIRIIIWILFIIWCFLGICICKLMCKFECVCSKTVTARVHTDRQTNKHTNGTNQHTCDFRK